LNFTDLDQLVSWIKTEGWMQAKNSSGLTMKEILMSEATRLKNIIQDKIQEYYNSYSPQVYIRTENLLNSLSVDKFVKVNIGDGRLSINIDFDEYATATHSIFGGDTFSDYNRASLINDGWEVKKDVWFREKEHFGWQDGFDFIGKAIQEFYADNPYNLKIHVEGFKNNYD